MLNPRHACSEWLIDEGGNLWPVGVPALRQKLGSDLPWGYLKRYAVENVGYCLVARRSQAFMSVFDRKLSHSPPWPLQCIG